MRAILGLKWDALLIVILAVSFGIYNAEWDPYWSLVDSPEERGSRPPDRPEGDVLLVLPDTPSDNAREFEELDTSYAWYNALWQRYGSFASTKLRNLSPELLAGRAVVIVPDLVGKRMPPNGFEALRTFVEKGGVLVVEMPSNEWTAMTQLTSAGKPRNASYAKIAVESGTIDVPVFGKRLPVSGASLDPDRVTLLVDGKPGVVRTNVGRGNVFSVAFEFGRSAIALQQGKPATGMTFEGRNIGKRSFIPETLRHLPVADLLERAVLDSVGDTRPIPSLWRFPERYRGATILFHPTFGPSTRTARTLSESSPGVLFVPSHIAWENRGGCVWSDQKLEPFARDGTMAMVIPTHEQISVTEQITDDCVATVVHRHLWDTAWSRSLRKLSAAGAHIDFSFAPSSDETGGFAFGTSYPFYPIDVGGLPLPLLVMPTLLTEFHITELDTFAQPEPFYASPITVEIPNDGMKTHPSDSQLFSISDIEIGSVRANSWFTTPVDFLKFVSARRQTVMTSQWFESDRRLVISLDVTKELDVPAPSVAIPEPGIFTIVLDGEAVALDEVSTLENHRIVELESGRHTIEVLYQSLELPPVPNLERLD